MPTQFTIPALILDDIRDLARSDLNLRNILGRPPTHGHRPQRLSLLDSCRQR